MRTHSRQQPPIFIRYSPLVAALAMALAPHGAKAGTFTVKNDLDRTWDGEVTYTAPDSFRAALEYFQNSSHCAGDGSDEINFDPGPFTIRASESHSGANDYQSFPQIECNGLTIRAHAGIAIDGASRQLGQRDYTNTTTFYYCGLLVPSRSYRAKIVSLEMYGFNYGGTSSAALCGNVDVDSSSFHNNGVGLVLHDNSQITGNTVYANGTGIFIDYGGSILSGNFVYSNTIDGIEVNQTDVTIGSGDTGAPGNSIGLDAAGASAGNAGSGILAHGSTAWISGNFISANATGIYLQNDQASTIDGNNYIGTDTSGTTNKGNSIGINIDSFSYGTTISGNLISGNGMGIELMDTDSVTVSGNSVGTDVTRTARVANGTGISATCSGAVQVTGNYVSGNGSNGIDFAAVQYGGSPTVPSSISGNFVGVQGNGVTALPNNAYGVLVRDAFCGTPSSAPAAKVTSHVFSGDVQVQGNTIAYNSFSGLALQGAYRTTISGNTIHDNTVHGVRIDTGTNNEILDNPIYDNGVKNVSLFEGVLDNDAGDIDGSSPDIERPNTWQNYPASIAAVRNTASNTTTFSFTLDSTPGTYRIDFWTDPSGRAGGKQHLGSTSYTVGSGPGSFVYGGASPAIDHFSLTATSTASPGNTSEFSPNVAIQTSPAASIVPSPPIDFGNVAIGTRSSDRMIRIQSTGGQPFVINQLHDMSCTSPIDICYGGSFSCTTDCQASPFSYTSPDSCTITAAFVPSALGFSSRTIALCDNSVASPRSITLQGTGVTPPPVNITPSSWDFGDVLVGKQGPPHTFTVTNPGAIPVAIGPVSTSGDFAVQRSDCPGSLQPATSCTADVTFNPTQTGPTEGTVQVGTASGETAILHLSPKVLTDGPTPAYSTVTGNGIVAGELELPSDVEFGGYTVGTPAIARTVEIRNNGNTFIVISRIAASPPFTAASACPSTLGPGAACNINLTFSSATVGEFNGTLTLVTSASGGSSSVPLHGIALSAAAPILKLSATNMGFGERLLGTTSPTQRVTITNIGSVEAVIGSIVASNTDFLVVTNGCAARLAPALSCFADIAMRPVGFGQRVGQVFVNSNAAGSPAHLDLGGTGCRPFMPGGSRSGLRFNCAP
jgi:parallel beta-helix repeat protein